MPNLACNSGGAGAGVAAELGDVFHDVEIDDDDGAINQIGKRSDLNSARADAVAERRSLLKMSWSRHTRRR